MSIFEKEFVGNWAQDESTVLINNIVDAVARSPELAKDRGLKQAGQNAALDIYYKVLLGAGVPEKDINTAIEKVAKRLKEKPRKETIIFARTIKNIVSSAKNGNGKQI